MAIDFKLSKIGLVKRFHGTHPGLSHGNRATSERLFVPMEEGGLVQCAPADFWTLFCNGEVLMRLDQGDPALALLTDNSGGSANSTIAAITNAANAGSADVGPVADAIADLAAKVNALIRGSRRYATTIDGGVGAVIYGGTKGIVFDTGASPTSGHDMVQRGATQVTPAAGKMGGFVFPVIEIDDADKLGIQIGIVAATGDELFTADPTDGIFITKAPTSTTLYGRVKGNGGTAANVTLATMTDAGQIRVSCWFYIGATAAETKGGWVVGTSAGVYTETPFSAAQITQLFAMLTTPQAMTGHVGVRVSGTDQKTATMKGIIWMER